MSGRYKALIVGVARDIDVGRARHTIEAIGQSLGGDYRVFLYENDSFQSCVLALSEWVNSNPRVEIKHDILSRVPAVEELRRMLWLSEYRNEYVKWIRMQPLEFETVIVLDPDINVFEPEYCVREVLDEYAGNFDMIGSRGEYDTWAYRDEIATWDLPSSYLETKIPTVTKRVWSCFGGLGIYRREIFERYHYVDPTWDCEHVRFHRQLLEAGFDRIYLEPKLFTWRDEGGVPESLPESRKSAN